jgi:hypothetical protein
MRLVGVLMLSVFMSIWNGRRGAIVGDAGYAVCLFYTCEHIVLGSGWHFTVRRYWCRVSAHHWQCFVCALLVWSLTVCIISYGSLMHAWIVLGDESDAFDFPHFMLVHGYSEHIFLT